LSLIPFNQNIDLIPQLDPIKHEMLLRHERRFNGLCEFICNRVLIDNQLGNESDQNAIKNRVTVERMDEDRIKNSHLLDVYSLFRRIIAYLFGIYPDNVFSICDQWRLVNKVSSTDGKIRRIIDKNLLSQGLSSVAEGETLKLAVFNKIGLKLSGHSLLIKKMMHNKYVFFDPNAGAYQDLSFVQLRAHIDEQLSLWNGTDLFLTRGQDFLKRAGVQ
jgi:ribosomal protein L28